MRAKTTITEIDAKIEMLREKRSHLLAKANERFTSAAHRAGLAEIDISDGELAAIFAEIAARFRKGDDGASGPST
jgi:hypothetical protein